MALSHISSKSSKSIRRAAGKSTIKSSSARYFDGCFFLIAGSKRSRYSCFGGSYVYNAALLRDASPVFDVSAQSAPTLIIQGTRDSVVPQSQAMELYQTLQRDHVPVQYLSYNGGHTFKGL